MTESSTTPLTFSPFSSGTALFQALIEHSADLITAFFEFFKAPRSGEVYNIGGGRFSNCSMLEAIAICEEITGKKLDLTYTDLNRTGDHMWWISDLSRFTEHYPNWKLKYDIRGILKEIFEHNQKRWLETVAL